ncbi:MAG: hypothetical protein IJQ39_09510 [Thermoguttaceae bacterium]|nr:hypothetical protein [Thermoguttaceae bacterium]
MLYVPDLSGLTLERRPNGKGEIANLHIVPSWRLFQPDEIQRRFRPGESVLPSLYRIIFVSPYPTLFEPWNAV